MSLLTQLQGTLGEEYRIERELGGGGMSRVFLAMESALGRTVVIKVVAPGLVEGLSADRFAREVKVAARLQQANIVPLLNAAPITSKEPAIPPALASVVMRCMEKDPGHRPSAAGELLSALDSASTPPPPAISTAPTGVPNVRRMRPMIGVAGALLLVGAGAWFLTRGSVATGTSAGAASPVGAEKSLAVMPFESAGRDTANAYFAEGIADELTTALARVPGLRLAGRNSAARYRGQGASAPEVGKTLNVATVLAGSLRRAGDRVRVRAELTSAADGSVLWQETFERRVEDVFAVQDEIASAIASALQMRLGNTSIVATATMGTADFEAYDLYLRGLQLYRRRRGAELREAERLLEQAIAKDKKFARAYATFASTLLVQPYYLDIRMGSVLPRARAAAERAVALAPDLPEALAALGHVHTESFEWTRAEPELRRAYQLAPMNSEIGFRLGFMYITSGRSSLAIPVLEQVKRIDPFYAISAMYLAWSLSLAGRNSAISEARRALKSGIFASFQGNARFARVLRRYNIDAATITSSQVARTR